MKPPKRLRIKDPNEKIFVVADYTDYLTTGETISSQVWEMYVKTGTDASATAMISGTPTKTNSTCTQLIIDGVNGNDYVASCLATTSLGQVLKLSYLIPVRIQEKM
jgi:hypothetical protein